MMHWHHEGHFHHDPSELPWASEYQLIKDGRPNGTTFFTSDDLQAFSPETENSRIATHHNRHTHKYTRENSNEYTREHNPGEFLYKEAFRPETENPRIATHHHGHAHEYTGERNPREFVYKEDINTEAEDFIQSEHQKFNLRLYNRTWSSG